MKYIIIWLVVFLVIFLLELWIYKESTGFKITEYDLKLDKEVKENLRFVFLSDLHDTDTGNNNEKLLEAIDEAKPDFVLMAGDMITSYMQPKYNSEITFSFLEELSKKHKIYYSMGNHEHRYLYDEEKFPGKFDELMQFCKKNNIKYLDNEKVSIEDKNCNVYGLTIPIEYYKRVVINKLPEDFIPNTFGKTDEKAVNILLAHNPDQFKVYAKWNPDVVCSGHVHGGIIGVPFLGGLIAPSLHLFPKYDSGLFYEGKSVMVLSRGLGWHTLPIRIFNKAEMIVINISGK